MSEQPPWQPPQGWPPPANPYGYPPPPNPYAAAPPNPYAVPTYGYPSPSPYSYAPSPPAHRVRALVIVGVVLALLVTVAAVAGAHPQSSTASSSGSAPVFVPAPASPSTPAPLDQANQPNPSAQPSAGVTSDGVTATSTVSPMSGIEVYSDDFTDPTSGWATGSDPKGAVFAYAADGYTVTSTVAAHWLAYAPYDDAVQQISLDMTAHESASASTTAGFGLVCRRGPDSSSNVRYEFVVNETNHWFIERNEGAVTMSSTPTILEEGALPTTLGTQDLEISGICATLADGQTTRLALFVGSQKVADTTDVADLDSDGWLGGLISSGEDAKSTTTVAGYTVSDLGNDGILAANT